LAFVTNAGGVIFNLISARDVMGAVVGDASWVLLASIAVFVIRLISIAGNWSDCSSLFPLESHWYTELQRSEAFSVKNGVFEQGGRFFGSIPRPAIH
jgi:hypothetical protein